MPKKALRKFKEIALRRQKSVSKMMVEMMEETIQNEEGYRAARDRHLHRLETAPDLQTNGAAPWRRDDLHER